MARFLSFSHCMAESVWKMVLLHMDNLCSHPFPVGFVVALFPNPLDPKGTSLTTD